MVTGEDDRPGPPQRPPRRDALPEHVHYLDTGCDLHPSCLTCPFVRCRYDDPLAVRLAVAAERDRGVLRLREQGISPESIARRFGVSRRTVFRVFARARVAGLLPARACARPPSGPFGPSGPREDRPRKSA